MRGSFAHIGRSSIAAAALALGLSLGAGVFAVPAAVAKDAPKATNSPEFGKVAGPFQKTLTEVQAKKGKVSDAEFKTDAAGLIPQLAAMETSVKTPLDKIIFGQWQYMVGGWADDAVLGNKGLQNMLDSGQLPADKTLLVSAMLGQNAYSAKDYATAIKVLGPLASNPSVQDVVPEMLVESYASNGQPKEGLAALKSAIAARKAANVAVPEEWYARANRIAYNSKLPSESIEWALAMAAAYPSQLNWLSAAQLVRNSSTSFTSQEELDVSRLMDQSGALKLEPKYVEREYVAYLQAIDARRFPGEAVRITEQGLSTGALKAEDTFVKDTLAQARPRIAPDKASLPGLAKDAAAAPNGKVAMAAADAYLAYGEAAKADELFTLALTKGGIDADKDRVLTRLGIAQIDEGKYADAKATLAKVTGPRVPIAQLWSTFAEQKASAK
ncbi:hypothetical protein Y88_0651 [Novosphingobium nitrogenifigens DSM 19370]|uniref:Tetratricopeptide repeat protein n=1 Tax=Novosphingobium nitrogenifigens DSM 19370 TaxID=983920 RepID=F1Z9Z7_9SPHN|nr:hypothetical protein [Novosphingobium nitrogenifigens]EGD58594.1 hypothetical protein Y88_0651 [Novosphingobium nitrogenifigens DSM 19370]